MLILEENISLKKYNSFGIQAFSKKFFSLTETSQLKEVFEQSQGESIRVHGGGSNMLLTKDFEGLTLVIATKGISIINENDASALVEVQAGENWHEFVLWCLKQNLGGVENLALIPGSVGASPIQNIGAYGVELKSVFHSCEVFEIENHCFKTFLNKECLFGYRDSIFKNKRKGMDIITSVRFKLQKAPHDLHVEYGDIQKYLEGKKHSIQEVAKAVISIRKSKLPDPKEIGNSGSFFKNPILKKEHFERLFQKYSDLPHYPNPDGTIKVPAGWLIEKMGFKGIREGDAGVHTKQALVLVNYANATGMEILALAEKIQKMAKKEFDISLETEVNIL
ncbi:UDP-N-acetylmuramate dehydrogenase [Flavobacteriaceae bacterium]|nr:UDP-N-acetylmuramate dehydrogenase [Flavobacteriaceae bacterium]MDB4269397.1 UDP-N-acetylmuramate dehydrogenase [Flavobacteriaceae bacterium]